MGGILTGFWSLLKNGFEYLGYLFASYYVAFCDYWKYVFLSCCQWLQTFAYSYFKPIFENHFGNFLILNSDLAAQIDYFVPLSEMCALIQILLGIWIAVLTIKIILKLIPTVY